MIDDESVYIITLQHSNRKKPHRTETRLGFATALRTATLILDSEVVRNGTTLTVQGPLGASQFEWSRRDKSWTHAVLVSRGNRWGDDR